MLSSCSRCESKRSIETPFLGIRLILYLVACVYLQPLDGAALKKEMAKNKRRRFVGCPSSHRTQYLMHCLPPFRP